MSGANLAVYNRADVTAHYALLSYLTPCEQVLFEQYVRPGSAILDLGVGGGRTTPYLSEKASRYVGVDYAAGMIQACRMKYPHLEFRIADASDLSSFRDHEFDAIVCAFNGIDYVVPDEARSACFSECYRILRSGGIFLFSSHNPRSVLIRSGWNRQRIRDLASKLAQQGSFVGEASFLTLSTLARCLALSRSIRASATRILQRIPKRAFWRGEGYLLDAAHGGLLTHHWVPSHVIAELERHGFRCVKFLGDDYPAVSRECSTDWYYYVFSKVDVAGNGATCES